MAQSEQQQRKLIHARCSHSTRSLSLPSCALFAQRCASSLALTHSCCRRSLVLPLSALLCSHSVLGTNSVSRFDNTCVRVCVRVGVRVRARVRACVWVWVRARVRARVCMFVSEYEWAHVCVSVYHAHIQQTVGARSASYSGPAERNLLQNYF